MLYRDTQSIDKSAYGDLKMTRLEDEDFIDGSFQMVIHFA